ncbi:hypothetical protein [Hansschlegelia zhihuaiae]|uniref:Uncharacterized protein n=1 Tax=Hansschlegelia zhihuaiae TaxID=405005 RepID=A0A4Q0MPQ6_9HYPH|nr:hypothetical protein [Hansschlegelia zhihuaiae]RXF75046.1 hypothetical protein EK403_03075 [Hansschlegelia zhihuaiae]
MSSRRKSEYHSATLAIPVGLERIWAAIRSVNADRASGWSVQDVAHRAKSDPHIVRPYVRGLRAAGYVKLDSELKEHGRTTPFYRLEKTSREAPRVRPDGRELPEIGREILWRSMKLMKSFTIAELAAAAAEVAPGRVGAATAKRYVLELARVGVLQMAAPVAGREPGRFRLVKPLGAAAPRILAAHIVFDPNADVILGTPEAREVV